jgi:DNA-binding NarL/FixJ family response regulator
MKTRVLVADGLTVFRAAVRNVIARERDFHVAEAADLPEVLQTTESGCVDIALVDLGLPPEGALPAIAALRERCDTEVVVWSFEPDQATVFAALRAGASGYLHKEISPRGLVRSLRGAANGEAPLSRELMALMIDSLHSLEEREHARSQAAALSQREREVLDHVARGARNRQIAKALSISEFTVKRHVQNILAKLDLPSRHAAARLYNTTVADAAAADRLPA